MTGMFTNRRGKKKKLTLQVLKSGLLQACYSALPTWQAGAIAYINWLKYMDRNLRLINTLLVACIASY